MPFRHLVDPPRACDGGVIFSFDRHAIERTVLVTDAAVAALDPDAATPRGRVQAVMVHLRDLIETAIARTATQTMPELVVLDAADIKVRSAEATVSRGTALRAG